MIYRVLEKEVVKVGAHSPRGETKEEELRVQLVTKMMKYGTAYFITIHHNIDRIYQLESSEENHMSTYRNILEKIRKGNLVLNMTANGRVERIFL